MSDRCEWTPEQVSPLDPTECLDGPNGCEGPVLYRMALSATGRPFPRCESHWQERVARQEDFDPSYAGERWDED